MATFDYLMGFILIALPLLFVVFTIRRGLAQETDSFEDHLFRLSVVHVPASRPRDDVEDDL
jgi:hypothetical protein